jgi:hypothetical protein
VGHRRITAGHRCRSKDWRSQVGVHLIKEIKNDKEECSTMLIASALSGVAALSFAADIKHDDKYNVKVPGGLAFSEVRGLRIAASYFDESK